MYDETFTIVGPVDPRDPQSRPIVPYGAVARALAHSSFRVPHAAVHVLPVTMQTGRILLHQRSAQMRVSPLAWDMVGGHVTFEASMPLTAAGLAQASQATALRELREELLLTRARRPYVVPATHVRQVGAVGALTTGLDDPRAINVEYSTLYVAAIPVDASAAQLFELRDGGLRTWLDQDLVTWNDIVAGFATPGGRVGDALTRMIRHCAADPAFAAALAEAIAWCRECAPAGDAPDPIALTHRPE
ncbi:NUDIX domain-containing protein [Oscillochloris sp. ZM17-4]|uniref:NUDIX domain-containing protein n=1 Tax=Oscillochloris sp. ZM17-4 TaxID=2866714 RepID=UPI001C72E39F|nr:NUDIX domain-containing protein [Oscillochloris sp. ZM17-4]MBX0329660.1 NUDIX domain-containing protein [Oscillochloris sp. ZM17-4]